MLKRDRTYDERRFDAMLKSGLKRLGENSSVILRDNSSRVTEPLRPSTYSHVLMWDRLGRKGQRCRFVNPDRIRDRDIQVEFEDGFIAVVNRRAIRRLGGS